MSPRTLPGGITITRRQQPVGSRAFITILGTILGIVVSTTTLVGFTGKYFFVDRTEYNQKVLRDADERGETHKMLLRVETILAQQEAVLERQEKAFDRLSDLVRNIELQVSKRNR